MSNIKNSFTINDLENFTNIKAHTIRIWEKRYNLLNPDRKVSGIRYYKSENLKKILNVTTLYNEGHKISKIAKYSDKEINQIIKGIALKADSNDYHINKMLLAMVNFDSYQFNQAYYDLVKKLSFEEVFKNYLIPLLQQIGVEWQSSAIKPSHEHFISNLVTQKLQIEIEKHQSKNKVKYSEKTFILFLPENEEHELALLYTHYYLIKSGYESIYLGRSIEIEDLYVASDEKDNVEFISSFSVAPVKDKINKYLKAFKDSFDRPLWLSGFMTSYIDKSANNNVRILKNISDLNKIV